MCFTFCLEERQSKSFRITKSHLLLKVAPHNETGEMPQERQHKRQITRRDKPGRHIAAAHPDFAWGDGYFPYMGKPWYTPFWGRDFPDPWANVRFNVLRFGTGWCSFSFLLSRSRRILRALWGHFWCSKRLAYIYIQKGKVITESGEQPFPNLKPSQTL